MAKDYDDLLQLRTTIMRTIISAIFVMLALTAVAYAAEQPFPWEMPHEQLGPLLKEIDPRFLNKERFVQFDPNDNQIYCVSKNDLFRWRTATTKARQQLNLHGKCIHAPVGWRPSGFTPHGSFSELWFINPSGTHEIKLWAFVVTYSD